MRDTGLYAALSRCGYRARHLSVAGRRDDLRRALHGRPVVSYYTERHSTRFTYSLLANIGLSDLASTSLADYVETAVALAGNLDLLDALHRELRDRMKVSPVMDQERYIREMEECYRAIWNAWESENTSL